MLCGGRDEEATTTDHVLWGTEEAVGCCVALRLLGSPGDKALSPVCVARWSKPSRKCHCEACWRTLLTFIDGEGGLPDARKALGYLVEGAEEDARTATQTLGYIQKTVDVPELALRAIT